MHVPASCSVVLSESDVNIRQPLPKEWHHCHVDLSMLGKSCFWDAPFFSAMLLAAEPPLPVAALLLAPATASGVPAICGALATLVDAAPPLLPCPCTQKSTKVTQSNHFNPFQLCSVLLSSALNNQQPY